MTRLVFNFLAICGAALFTGAMLNIALSFGAYWRSLAPLAFLDWFGQNSHLIGRTIPIFVLPTLAGLAASLWLDWNGPGRTLWLLAAACFAAVLMITAAYHLPTNSAFVARSIAPDQVAATLNTWLTLHAARVALAFGAAVLGFVAMQRPA